MRFLLVLFSMLFVCTTVFSQVTIKIKELSISNGVADSVSVSDVDFSINPRVKLKVEIHNDSDKPLKFRGDKPYDSFYVTFNHGDTTCNRVECIVNTANIPYNGEEMYLDHGWDNMYYVDINPNTSYDATLYIRFGFSEDNYQAEFTELIDSIILEYNRRDNRSDKGSKYLPLKPGEYKIVDESNSADTSGGCCQKE